VRAETALRVALGVVRRSALFAAAFALSLQRAAREFDFSKTLYARHQSDRF
jgi:hypothetical protein